MRVLSDGVLLDVRDDSLYHETRGALCFSWCEAEEGETRNYWLQRKCSWVTWPTTGMVMGKGTATMRMTWLSAERAGWFDMPSTAKTDRSSGLTTNRSRAEQRSLATTTMASGTGSPEKGRHSN